MNQALLGSLAPEIARGRRDDGYDNDGDYYIPHDPMGVVGMDAHGSVPVPLNVMQPQMQQPFYSQPFSQLSQDPTPAQVHLATSLPPSCVVLIERLPIGGFPRWRCCARSVAVV
jgi:hypothetical protein